MVMVDDDIDIAMPRAMVNAHRFEDDVFTLFAIGLASIGMAETPVQGLHIETISPSREDTSKVK